MALGAILGAVGGFAQAFSANKAAKSQEAAANRQIDVGQQIYGETTARFQPFLDAGVNALADYSSGIGQGYDPFPTYTPERYAKSVQFKTPENFRSFEEDPGYQFRLQQGMEQLEGSAAANGNLLSGNTLKDLVSYNQGMASQEFAAFDARRARDLNRQDQNLMWRVNRQDGIESSRINRSDQLKSARLTRSDGLRDNYLNRVGALAQGGQAAAANSANAGANYQTVTTNALTGIGNAQSAGAVGVGNAISGGINNYLAGQQYNDMFNRIYPQG